AGPAIVNNQTELLEFLYAPFLEQRSTFVASLRTQLLGAHRSCLLQRFQNTPLQLRQGRKVGRKDGHPLARQAELIEGLDALAQGRFGILSGGENLDSLPVTEN